MQGLGGRCPVAVLLFFGAVLGGCAAPRPSFAPTENVRELGGGRSAAYYEIRLGDRNWGDVKIWWAGASEHAPHGAAIAIGMRIRNDGQAAIVLDLARTELEVTGSDGSLRVLRQPVLRAGALTVAPGEIQRLQLVFALGRAIELDEVVAIELDWAIRTPAGTFTESTPFRRRWHPEGRYAYWYWESSYCYPYGYWGWCYDPWYHYHFHFHHDHLRRFRAGLGVGVGIGR
ncbi:MAG: hypothetical protein KatS3mg102_2336 [Planctomycetota bacterium]|nr:MAG: hypothetical protein KatS3mg102_2336 [Planctomycetota bacterium]